jgi:hypothetical protein
VANTNESRVAEVRTAIKAANVNLSFAEADAKAREFVRDEQVHAELAALQAAAEAQVQAEDDRRAAQRDLFSAGGNSGGPTSKELLTQLQDAYDRGEGW